MIITILKEYYPEHETNTLILWPNRFLSIAQ